MLLKAKGRKVTYQDVLVTAGVKSEGAGSSAGTSLESIKQTCGVYGLDVQVLKLNPAELARVGMPAIIHFAGVPDTDNSAASKPLGHYVLLLYLDDRTAVYVDPTSGYPEESARGDFLRVWSGYAVIPTDQLPTPILSQQLTFVGAGVAGAAFVLTVIWLVRRRVWTAFRRGRMVVTAVAITIVQTGCSSHSTEADQSLPAASSDSRFEITAFKLESDVGVLPADGRLTTATFDIWNSGSVAVTLELGTPSCACSHAELSTKQLGPGETAQLILALKATGTAGRKSAGVQVAAIGQPWSHTFKIVGVETGLSFPTDQHYFAADSRPLLLSGRYFYTGTDDDVMTLTTTISNADARAYLSVGPPDLGPPVSVGQCRSRTVDLLVKPNPGSLSILPDSILSELVITAGVTSQSSQQVVRLVLESKSGGQ